METSELIDLYDKLEQALSDSLLEEAISYAKRLTIDNPELTTIIEVREASYSRLKTDEGKGLLTREERERTYNHITNALSEIRLSYRKQVEEMRNSTKKNTKNLPFTENNTNFIGFKFNNLLTDDAFNEENYLANISNETMRIIENKLRKEPEHLKLLRDQPEKEHSHVVFYLDWYLRYLQNQRTLMEKVFEDAGPLFFRRVQSIQRTSQELEEIRRHLTSILELLKDVDSYKPLSHSLKQLEKLCEVVQSHLNETAREQARNGRADYEAFKMHLQSMICDLKILEKHLQNERKYIDVHHSDSIIISLPESRQSSSGA